MPPGAPRISAVIVNYHGAHLLPDCLESLARQTVPVETVVVDNGSRDGSAEVVARYPGVRWVPLGTNAGLARGYNAGAQATSSELIFFANNDMAFAPDCLEKLARAIDECDAFCADAKHFDWNTGVVTHGAQRVAWTKIPAWPQLPFLDLVEDRTAKAREYVIWGCAGAFMVRRKPFLELGGFDRRFFLYMEDADLCLRAWLRGWRTVYEPAATLRHRVSASHDEKLLAATPVKPPRTARRARASAEINSLRVALKVLPLPWVLASFASLLARAARDTFRLRSTALYALIAVIANVMDLPAILHDRKEARADLVFDYDEIVARFLVGSTPRPEPTVGIEKTT